MNKILITGRLTNDVELKQTPSGVSVCSFSVAVNRPKVKDVTDFLDVVVFRQTAEYVSKYSKKGDRIAVTGVMTVRTYEKDGAKRRAYEIQADECEILTDKPSNSLSIERSAPNGNQYIPEQYKKPMEQKTVDDCELPF